MIYHFRLSRINKFDRDFFYGQSLSHCFNPISPYARAKMAAIVNKVYTQDKLETMVMHLFGGKGMGKQFMLWALQKW